MAVVLAPWHEDVLRGPWGHHSGRCTALVGSRRVSLSCAL